MDGNKILMIDLVNFLESIENKIMNKKIDLSDIIQITNLKYCFNTMDSMLKQCETSVSTQDLNEIRDRIKVAKETVEILENNGNLKETDLIYGDLYLINQNNSKIEDYKYYGRHLGISNDEFDKMIEDWAQDLDTSQKDIRKRKVNKNESFQEQIKGEMAQLADALLKFTGEQEKQLDTVTHVARESTKLSKSANFTFMQLIFMALSMIGLTMFILFLFLIT